MKTKNTATETAPEQEPELSVRISEPTAKGIEALRQVNDAIVVFLRWVNENYGWKEWSECWDGYCKTKETFMKMLARTIGEDLEFSGYEVCKD